MIEVKQVTKSYRLNGRQQKELKTKDKVKVAVEGISLQAKEGEIYGILGPNGAGKTTLLRCIATLLKPDQGEILVNGFDVVRQGDEVRKRTAFLTNEIKLDPHFSCKYQFYFYGRMYGMTDQAIQARQEELFAYFGITPFQDKRIEELSTGMKQKASIAVSLVHDPEVIIFDEPTNGLDIITARAVTRYLQKMREEGKLVIVSTHIMSEAQKLCDRIAMVVDGTCIAQGTISEILEQTQGEDLEEAFFVLYEQERKEMP